MSGLTAVFTGILTLRVSHKRIAFFLLLFSLSAPLQRQKPISRIARSALGELKYHQMGRGLKRMLKRNGQAK